MTDTTAVSLPQTPDADRVAAFEARLLKALNDGGMLAMLSLGHRTGLLQAMAGAAPASAAAIAQRAGLHPRYVREWLGAMVTADVVIMDPDADTYHLPPEHAARLVDGEANLAVYAQFIPLLGSVEDDIVDCFRNGGGVPYARYPRFHEVMAQDSYQTVVAALTDYILPLIPGLIGRLEQGIRVLDLACGRGRALLTLAQHFPASRFTGYELSAEAVAWARDQAAALGLANVAFHVRDLTDFDRTAEPGAFDLVTTFDGIHDQGRPLAVLTGARRALADGGVYLMQDIHGSGHHHSDRDNVLGTLLYAVSCMHCTPVSLAQGGEGLGTMWGRKKALAYLEQAGFSEVTVQQLPHDVMNDYFICRP